MAISQNMIIVFAVETILCLSCLGWLVRHVLKLQKEVVAEKKWLGLLPLAELIQRQLMNALHHDEEHFKEPDALIDKFVAAKITQEESSSLEAFLVQRKNDPRVSEEERQNADTLLGINRLVALQAKNSVAADGEKKP